jgi:hypothetical protein
MLQHVINSLHAMGVQGASNPSTNLQLESDTTSTGGVKNMDVCTKDTVQMVTSNRDGMVSASSEAPGRHKRPDHKPSPRKKDFCKDE